MTAKTLGFILTLAGLGALAAGAVYRAVNHMVDTNPAVSRMVSGSVPVETARARNAAIDEVVGAAGEVRPAETVSYVAPVQGRVRRVAVESGSVVRRGDVLVEWDDRTFLAAVERAERRVEAARSALDHSHLQVERVRYLHEGGLVPYLDLERARVEESQSRLVAAEAEEELVRARVEMENARMVSPLDGIVLERLVNPDESTHERERTLLVLADLASVTFAARIGEDRLRAVREGQQAEVTFAAYPGEVFTGIVSRIEPRTDSEARTFTALLRIENADLRLRPGLVGFARIRRRIDGLAVPSAALLNPLGDRATVFVVGEDRRAKLREVKIGAVSDRLAEVTEGLTDGEEVVTVGQFRLREDDVVRTGGIPPVQ